MEGRLINQKKKLHGSEIFAIVVGAIIGMGSFMLPGAKFLDQAGVINTTIGLFIGTMTIVVIERSYRFMMSQNINEGGEFSYTKMFLGKKHSFVVGWYLFLAYLSLIPLNALAMPIVVNYIFPDILNFGYLYTIANDPVFLGEILVSTAVILIFMAINLVGVKNTGKVQRVIIYFLLISIFIITIGTLATADFTAFNVNYVESYQFDFGAVMKIIAVTPFLFIGFDAIPQLVNDIDVSKRKASTISIVALLFGMMVYMILNFLTGLYYAPSEAVALDWALGSGVLANLGQLGFLILVIALACAVVGGINGFMVCSTKLIGAMAKEEILPKSFAGLNKHGVAKNTIYFVSIVGIITCFFGREVVVWIVDMCSFGAAVAYFYVCLITATKGVKKSDKIFGWIGVAMSCGIALMLLLPMSPAHLSTPPLIFLSLWTIIGAIFGFILFKKPNNTKPKQT